MSDKSLDEPFRKSLCKIKVSSTEAYLEPFKIYGGAFFAKVAKGLNLLTSCAKSSIDDVRLSSKYVCGQECLIVS